MPRIIVSYVRIVEAVNYRVGRMAMYLIFVLMAILMWSSISKTFFSPALWTLETAQFVMVAYYLLGGPYSMQLNSHVRMDLVYGSWSIKTKAWVDAFTIFGLIFYLVILLQGAIGSTAYSLGQPYNVGPYDFFGQLFGAFFTGGFDAASEVLGHMERSATSFRPYLWPIKSIATLGIFLMLLQAIAVFFKDVATIRGEEL